MKKIFVLAVSYTHYMTFCRNFELNPYKDACFINSDHERLLGLGRDHSPLILLEDWQYNPNYKVSMGPFLNFFYNFGKFEPYFISEGELWDENFKF